MHCRVLLSFLQKYRTIRLNTRHLATLILRTELLDYTRLHMCIHTYIHTCMHAHINTYVQYIMYTYAEKRYDVILTLHLSRKLPFKPFRQGIVLVNETLPRTIVQREKTHTYIYIYIYTHTHTHICTYT